MGVTAPAYGSFDDLKGQVQCVNPADYKVVVYIYVETGYWIKPYAKYPLTTIQADGSFQVDITTGGLDHLATQVAVFLVPNGYNPPIVLNSTLPS